MTVYTRLGNGYTNAGTTSMPVIAPDGLNGNMYFETGIAGNTYIQDDTFLIYTREDGIDNTVAWREGGADFYYKYTETVNGKDCEVIIYGYNLTVGSADSAKGAQKPYAAIRMESGNMYARGGFYYSYFGVMCVFKKETMKKFIVSKQLNINVSIKAVIGRLGLFYCKILFLMLTFIINDLIKCPKSTSK